MKAAAIPDSDQLTAGPGGWHKVTFGPPPGLSEEQVYTHDALVGIMQGGPLDGSPAIQILIELEQGDLDRIRESGHLWLTLLTTALPPWQIEPADLEERDT